MRVVALISGGKDSTFNMMQCIAAGHQIVALANLAPHTKSEIDSFMYQSVGHEAIDFIAAALDLPLYKRETFGKANQQEKIYSPTQDDEVEDLFHLLSEMKSSIEFEAVSVGAILSDYQRLRVENVCIRLGLVPLAYLWQRNQEELLDEIIKCEVDAIVIKVAALGLEIKHLGRSLSLLQPHLLAMHEKYGLHVCGEGGEYETLTLDCPLFKSRIVIDDSEVVLHTDDPIAPVGYLKFNKLRLELKLPPLELDQRLSGLPLKDSDGYITDQGEEAYDLLEDEDESNNELVEEESKENNQISIPDHDPTFSRNQEGWLCIGGIRGKSQNPSEAMKETLSSLKYVLEENNQSLKDVCSVSMFINDMSQYNELNELYINTFNHVNPPARACVEIPLGEKCPILIDAISWQAQEFTETPVDRQTMHVQSRSHWAPSNIGPYSQSVRIGDCILLAGQIGMVPGNLEMVSGGIKSQCQLALRHIGRLLKAIDANLNLRDVVQGICYVTDLSYVEKARKIWESKTNNSIVDYVVVTGLPKNALVEWQVWAHRHNSQFEYEETGKCIDDYSISIFRRWNYENKIAAIVCHVENSSNVTFDGAIFKEAMNFAMQKLNQDHEDTNCAFKFEIFYPVKKKIEVEGFVDVLQELRQSFAVVYSFVPVIYLKNKNIYISIYGMRSQ